MDPTDISDVTGAAYTFLDQRPRPGRQLDRRCSSPGERVRLRFINAAAQTIFNVRIPGLKLTVVQADGQNVRPVEVDEFQIGNAETYDVIVQPTEDRAYTLVAEAVDRSGMGRATLAPRAGHDRRVPPLRERPLLTMKDMGMDMSAMARHGDSGMDHSSDAGHGPCGCRQRRSAARHGAAAPARLRRDGRHGSMDMRDRPTRRR